MIKTYVITACLLALLSLSGCSQMPDKMSIPDRDASRLHQEYQYWKGTPYRLGGSSKKGIDCSAFTQTVFQHSFGINIGRTTKVQARVGKYIKRNTLKVADLIFFKTGWKTRHVGIYMGNNQFLHASTSKGVIISSLDNVYWRSKYWQARRVID